ncbi:Rieske (2Fe-2S) protein [Flectobacillus major]|jgi:nitrite reductase/ring-hydroxylating ferredoxin subunit|uniref:Rieske (2Fe-2S) protein n=1 Tax=Flectobacillus major TaxID=103 RepID=UPI0004119D54|nr:Rieske 2Fe-2S domain-containing protein [Flectobacillus major]
MTRYDFLKSMGFKGGALMVLLASCQKSTDPSPSDDTTTTTGTSSGTTTGTGTSTGSGSSTTPATSTLASIDLTSSTYAALLQNGGYVIVNSIVVARISEGTYVAATQTCSHEPKKKVIFRSGEFYCTEHGARYSTTGTGLNSYGSKGIKVYTVTVSGSTLTIT